MKKIQEGCQLKQKALKFSSFNTLLTHIPLNIYINTFYALVTLPKKWAVPGPRPNLY